MHSSFFPQVLRYSFPVNQTRSTANFSTVSFASTAALLNVFSHSLFSHEDGGVEDPIGGIESARQEGEGGGWVVVIGKRVRCE